MRDVPTTHRALTPDERGAMEAALHLAAKLANEPLPLGFAQVQRLYDAMLAQTERDEDEVIALGMAFGAAINERARFDWVRVSDQWGDETCVGPPHKTIHVAPISMVQKRLVRNEVIDLEQFADSVIGSVKSKIAGNQTDSW
ncbi:MAG: DUF3806 domain-containing protein [Alphaproteobacteria bacterium]|nr:DUF3806 domain-containing protein [Alphaproteobacteria bacterium]